MYAIGSMLTEMGFLAQMAIDRKFDSGISVVEERSLVSYTMSELRRDVEEYEVNKGWYSGDTIVNLEKNIVKMAKENLDLILNLKGIENSSEFNKKSDKEINSIFINLIKEAKDHGDEKVKKKAGKLSKDIKKLYNLEKQYFDNVKLEVLNNPIVLELRDGNNDSYGLNELQKLIKKNSIKNDKIFNYIVSAADKATHFFLAQQQGGIVIIKDSLGAQERDDFFQKFVYFEQEGIDFYRTSTKLQYSSGVCETYPMLQTDIDIRMRLFNKNLCINKNNTEKKIQEMFVEREAKPYHKGIDLTRGNSLMERIKYSLYEGSFGVIENIEGNEIYGIVFPGFGLLSKRQNALRSQIGELEKLKKLDKDTKINEFAYSYNKSSSNVFVPEIKKSIKLLEYMNKNMSVFKDDNKDKYYGILATISGIKYKNLFRSISEDTDARSSFFNEENQQSEFKEACSFILNLKPETMGGKADNIAKVIMDAGMVDFSNPRTFIRAGYAYWKTLEYAEMFDRRVTRHILSNKNFTDKTKKAMLSAIYPYSSSFFVNSGGEDNIYHAIDRYYNGYIYSKVFTLLGESYRYNESQNVDVDVDNIFNDIIKSQDPLENLPHFISWNRSFREDIFKYVATAEGNDFNQKIVKFFFETEQVNRDYVNIVARKYTFKNHLTNENLEQFVNLALVTEGNDREDNTFKEALNNGKILFKNNYSFRQSISSYIVSKPEIENISYKINTLPIYKYLTENGEICDAFTIKYNLTRNPTDNINITKDYAKDFISRVAGVMSGLNESNISEKEKEIDEFAGAIKERVISLKATLAPKIVFLLNRSENQKKPTNEEQIWIDFQNKVKELEQQFNPEPENLNLKNLHDLFMNI